MGIGKTAQGSLYALSGLFRRGKAPAGPLDRDRELRSAVEELIQLRQREAAGASAILDPLAVAAAEIAASLWERAFASGESDVMAAAMLGAIGRDLVTRGESVWWAGDGSEPVRASSWDVRSPSVRPAEWLYRVTLSGPSGVAIRDADAAAVMHFRIRMDPRMPWKGRNPWEAASLTASLAARIEASLRDEEGGPVGHVLPVPDERASSGLADQLVGLRGAVAVGETMAAGWEGGAARAPGGSEWKPVRIGPAPTEPQRNLRADVQDSMLAAAGVPVELVSPSSGTDTREAWRRFLWSTIAPVGRVVAAEARRVIGGTGRIDWAALGASDLAGRARAYRQLRDAQMDDAEARRICGFTMEGS